MTAQNFLALTKKSDLFEHIQNIPPSETFIQPDAGSSQLFRMEVSDSQEPLLDSIESIDSCETYLKELATYKAAYTDSVASIEFRKKPALKLVKVRNEVAEYEQ